MDDRGREYSGENIREQLSLRDFNLELALNGLGAERRTCYGRKELKAMSDSLDRLLTKLLKDGKRGGSQPSDSG
jgi:uncharacterized protein YaiI (UPF0178 family)